MENNSIPLIGEAQSTVMGMVRVFRETLEASFEDVNEGPCKTSQQRYPSPSHASRKINSTDDHDRTPPSRRNLSNYDGYSDEDSFVDDGSYLTYETDTFHDVPGIPIQKEIETSRSMWNNLPDKTKIMSTGFILGRLSVMSLFCQKWRQLVWARYTRTQLLIFRNTADYESWINDGSITKEQRLTLVKLKLDFLEEYAKPGFQGLYVTEIKLKHYENRHLHQFKLDQWVSQGANVGPSIVGAFASQDEGEVECIRQVILKCVLAIPGKHGGGEYKQ
eukprot:CAMPEP_0194327482 /NCGR_PEP_ID=MMETSP0171-20130528/41243_1 /TAXON_ID=218684 /ORGANISM="Corethron pennatum, Strain L29A3" /LENGTH=275 /DNA_ID=CAMNT_0039087447 /DNA_START=53 /DNA_END=880 /DNA_ORIENTATION=+